MREILYFLSASEPIQSLRERPSCHSALPGPRFATRISVDRRRGRKEQDLVGLLGLSRNLKRDLRISRSFG
jgi:hypothetical protein